MNIYKQSRNAKDKHRTYDSIPELGHQHMAISENQRPDLISEYDLGMNRDYAT